MDGFYCHTIDEIVKKTERFPESYNEDLLRINKTQANLTKVADECVFGVASEKGCEFSGKISTVVPVSYTHLIALLLISWITGLIYERDVYKRQGYHCLSYRPLDQ